MKRQLIVFLAIGLLASCQEFEETGAGVLSRGHVAFTASNGDLSETKTLLQADNTISWLPQDEISVFYGDRKHARFVADGKETAQMMVFKGAWEGYDYKEGDTFWAIYPYSTKNAFDGKTYTVSLLAEQTAVAGSFADDIFVSIAQTKDFTMHFYNVCGGIKFCVTEPGIKTVQLEGNGNEPLAGTARVEFGNDGKPIVKDVPEPVVTVTLTPPDGSLFEVGEWYFMAVLPTSLEKGYRITLTKDDGTSSIKKYNKPVSVKRAVFGVLENLDSGLSYEIRVPENEIWYTTTDDNIVKSDYFTNLISNVYENGRGRMVFTRALTEIPAYSFMNQSNLESISLPESVTEIQMAAFSQTEGLRRIEMPGVTVIGNNAFEYSGLSGTLDLPESLERIEKFAFCQCKSIEVLIIPENVSWIGEGAFLDGSLHSAVIRPLTPPVMEDEYFSLDVPDNLYPNKTIIYVPEESLEAYQTAYGWRKCAGFMATEGKIPTDCFYASSDYSRDGEIIQLQAATEGKGVNLIILGDGYTDRDVVPGGKYEQRVRMEIEDFFALEPYKTFRNRFNVYMINCVSRNDVFFTPFNADRLFTYDLSFNLFQERIDVCEEYARKVVPLPSEPIYATIFLNRDQSVEAAFCSMVLGGSAGYMAYAFLSDRRNSGDPNVFSHEMGGHGFARLADEYRGFGLTAQESDRDGLDRMFNNLGWGSNVDWHSSPSEVRWSRFLSDSRYADEGLGVFEGGMVFEKGIYRCSEESVMNGTGPRGMGPSGYSGWFNAPSREAIYKQIMKLSEGPDWIYDYETFVEADAAGREQAASKYKVWKEAYEAFWAERDARETGKSSRSRYARPGTPAHRPPVIREDRLLEIPAGER